MAFLTCDNLSLFGFPQIYAAVLIFSGICGSFICSF